MRYTTARPNFIFYMRIKVNVLPRSSKNEIVGKLADGTLKIKLTAPPVDGEANAKLIEFLSKEWGIAKSKIVIVKGEKSKLKVIEIQTVK